MDGLSVVIVRGREMQIKTRDVTIGQSYCGDCEEAITTEDLILVTDANTGEEYRGCPHCHHPFEGWSTG